MAVQDEAFARFAQQAGVEEASFFGFRALRFKGKTFLVLTKDGLVFRLGASDVRAALGLGRASLWNPFGRVKKHWVHLPALHQDVWPDYFEEARRALETQTAT